MTVLGNLIDNAVEAVLAAGVEAPAVDVTLRTEEAGLLVRVVDNGPGVDVGTTRELFRRGRSGKGDGRGLGLALVGQSVRRHGGHVEVANDTGRMRGAVFTAWLPLEPLAERESKAGG